MSANQGAPGFASLRPLATLALVLGSLLASSATVAAQDERDTATARSLFEQGVELTLDHSGLGVFELNHLHVLRGGNHLLYELFGCIRRGRVA